MSLDEDIPHANKRVGKPSFDWSAELLKKFNMFYADDFEILGYPLRQIQVSELK